LKKCLEQVDFSPLDLRPITFKLGKIEQIGRFEVSRIGAIDKMISKIQKKIENLELNNCQKARIENEFLEKDQASEILTNIKNYHEVRLKKSENVSETQKMCELNGYSLEFLARDPINLIRPQEHHTFLFEFNEKNYCLSTKEGLIEFIDNPNLMINKVIANLKKFPEFIFTLNLCADFSKKLVPNEYQNNPNGNSFSEISIQTDVHPPTLLQIDSKAPENRFFTQNMWDVRKNLQMNVDLQNKRTHGCRTQKIVGHWRRDGTCQTSEWRDTSSQTTTSKKIGQPKILYHISGLRGKNAKKGLPIKKHAIKLI